MCIVLLPPAVNAISVNKYININITIHRHVSFASAIIIIIIRVPYKNTNNILCLLLFSYDTLMMVAEAAEIFRWVVIYDKTHFIIVHLSVCYVTKFDNLSRSVYILKYYMYIYIFFFVCLVRLVFNQSCGKIWSNSLPCVSKDFIIDPTCV